MSARCAGGRAVRVADGALLAALEPRPTRRVWFTRGYETTVRPAWTVELPHVQWRVRRRPGSGERR